MEPSECNEALDSKPPAVVDESKVGDEEDDDWSRQVETDETTAGQLHDDSFRMESVQEETSTSNAVPAPSHPELTMKERLVLRERQRRIETERARLKRQFAMSNGNAESDVDGGGDASVAEGTLGEESTKAHPDEESSEQEKLGFNMERFLRNSDNFNPELEPTDEDNPTADPGVLMERFLNGPVVVQPEISNTPNDVQRSVSFEAAASESAAAEPYLSSTNLSSTASVHVEADDEVARDALVTPATSVDEHHNDDDDSGGSDDEPRVLRLTEADMQEMAAIEHASIGNAPPSEREEEMLSEIGELADFGGPTHIDPSGNFSQDTPTTAQESASVISAGNQSGRAMLPSDHGGDNHSIMDGEGSDMHQPPPFADPHILLSPGAASAGVETHPPSIDEADANLLDDEVVIDQTSGLVPDEELAPTLPSAPATRVVDASTCAAVPSEVISTAGLGVGDSAAGLRLSHGTVPPSDVVVALQPQQPDHVLFSTDLLGRPSSPLMTERQQEEGLFRDLPPAPWSPGGKMQVSPIPAAGKAKVGLENLAAPFASANVSGGGRQSAGSVPIRNLPLPGSIPPVESTPLLSDVPPEIITHREQSQETIVSESGRFRRSQGTTSMADSRRRRLSSVRSVVDSVFSDLRSEEDFEKEEINQESELYLRSGIFARAFPERMFALTVTLLFEIPVLFMISGGSDALCQLVGRKRYQLLMGFIPLTSAISGNVGLQSSTLTTRAVSHRHVTPASYVPWLRNEIGAACCLGVAMGCLLGTIAFFASQMDFAFALTIASAQFISIVTAGCTGTFAPLLFSFIFQRDSGKWGGPLETAIQDIVGSFAMVVVSYHILKMLGPGIVLPGDECAAAPAE